MEKKIIACKISTHSACLLVLNEKFEYQRTKKGDSQAHLSAAKISLRLAPIETHTQERKQTSAHMSKREQLCAQIISSGQSRGCKFAWPISSRHSPGRPREFVARARLFVCVCLMALLVCKSQRARDYYNSIRVTLTSSNVTAQFRTHKIALDLQNFSVLARSCSINAQFARTHVASQTSTIYSQLSLTRDLLLSLLRRACTCRYNSIQFNLCHQSSIVDVIIRWAWRRVSPSGRDTNFGTD